MNIQQRRKAIQDHSVFISCVVPVNNEEMLVESFFTQLSACLNKMTSRHEIIVVDDGSQDNTAAAVQALIGPLNIKLIVFSRNFGKEIALTAGLEHCSGDVTIMMDGDFQHPIDLLPTFLTHWGDGFDMVYGIRNHRKNESAVKRNLAKSFYWIMSKITQIDVPNNAGDFRLLDRKVVATLNTFHERSRFMKGLYAWVGFKKIAVPFEMVDRAGGKSSWGFRSLTELAITGITSFSNVPLRVWGFIGFVVSTISLIYAIYFVSYTLLFGADLPGFPSIIVAVMFLGGIQLLSIGILGEYIARIFTEVKGRPKYIIEQKFGFD